MQKYPAIGLLISLTFAQFDRARLLMDVLELLEPQIHQRVNSGT